MDIFIQCLLSARQYYYSSFTWGKWRPNISTLVNIQGDSENKCVLSWHGWNGHSHVQKPCVKSWRMPMKDRKGEGI